MNPTALDEVAVTCFCLLERGPSLSRMRGLFSRGVVCRLSLEQENKDTERYRKILYSIKIETFGLFKHFLFHYSNTKNLIHLEDVANVLYMLSLYTFKNDHYELL